MAVATVGSQPSLSAQALLGGAGVLLDEPRSTLEWVVALRRGIPSEAVDALAASTRLTRTELATALGIPARTLARRKREVMSFLMPG